MNFKWQSGCWIANRKHWNTALLMLTHHCSSERDGFHYINVTFFILKFLLKVINLTTELFCSKPETSLILSGLHYTPALTYPGDLTVICRTSTLDTWQCVHVAIPRCDPWLGVSVISQENLGEAALEMWSLFLMFIKTSGPWSWNMAFPKKQT